MLTVVFVTLGTLPVEIATTHLDRDTGPPTSVDHGRCLSVRTAGHRSSTTSAHHVTTVPLATTPNVIVRHRGARIGRVKLLTVAAAKGHDLRGTRMLARVFIFLSVRKALPFRITVIALGTHVDLYADFDDRVTGSCGGALKWVAIISAVGAVGIISIS